jgi:hypothetical protein
MPLNLQNNIYHPSFELDIIQKRTIKNLSIFDTTQKIENTDINKVELNLQKTFNLNCKVGLFISSSNEKIVSTEVCFNIEFYKVLTISVQVPVPAQVPAQVPVKVPVKVPYVMDFYISKGGSIHGPWPTHCNEIKVIHNISTLDEAKNEARAEIARNPKQHIIEIVEALNFLAWTYSVKTFKTQDNTTTNIHIGKGRRHIAFDNTKFTHNANIISRLKNEGYY